MINLKVQEAINKQIKKEEFSSRLYLSMAIWAEAHKFPGAASFLYQHAEEERMHMMKLIRYVVSRGGNALVEEIEKPESEFDSLNDVFSKILAHEEYITASINDLYGVTIEEKDYTTGNFLQWFITEQLEEENLMSTILDKISLVGSDKAGMFHIDKELETMAAAGNTPAL
jgi:ferritin